jgi:hypothetical protein
MPDELWEGVSETIGTSQRKEEHASLCRQKAASRVVARIREGEPSGARQRVNLRTKGASSCIRDGRDGRRDGQSVKARGQVTGDGRVTAGDRAPLAFCLARW